MHQYFGPQEQKQKSKGLRTKNLKVYFPFGAVYNGLNFLIYITLIDHTVTKAQTGT